MVLRLIRDLPGDRALLPPSFVDHPTNLAPASGRQNHTTSPSAQTPLVAQSIAPGDVRPSHPAPNVRDDREPPLFLGCETSESIVLICPTTQCQGCATHWHDGRSMLMRYALLATSPLVIPGRRASVEPGIHFATEHAAGWIPG